MSTSAELRHPPRVRGRRRARACRGFTLLEVMVTLAIVAVSIVPLLGVRDSVWNMAYRSGHMLKAAAYAEQVLAERMTDPDTVKEFQAVIEEDPAFHYVLTLENYDLSTGRVETPDDDSISATSGFSAESAFVPADAAAPADEDKDVLNDPQRVRRFTLIVKYPGLNDDKEEEYLLEGYLPRAKKESDHAVPAAK